MWIFWPIGSAQDHIRHYHSLFGAKFCCYSDLSRYTDLLGDEDGAIFTQSLVEDRLPLDEEEGLSIATSVSPYLSSNSINLHLLEIQCMQK